MLSEDMIRLIEAYAVGCVATVRPDGAPAVSPKATFLVMNKQQIAFSHIRSPGTVENLLRRPDIEVNFVDVFAREGCRVRGIAEYLAIDQASSDLRAAFRTRWPELYGLMQGFVVINVSEAESLSSPSYDVGAVASDLVEHWLRHYAEALGFTVTKKGRGETALAASANG